LKNKPQLKASAVIMAGNRDKIKKPSEIQRYKSPHISLNGFDTKLQ